MCTVEDTRWYAMVLRLEVVVCFRDTVEQLQATVQCPCKEKYRRLLLSIGHSSMPVSVWHMKVDVERHIAHNCTSRSRQYQEDKPC